MDGPIDGAGLCTLVDIGSIFYTSVQGNLLLPGDFWHKIWNFLRTKTPLGFTIHTERHQFYWDRHTMWQDTFSNQLDRIFKLKRELNGGSKMPRNLMLKLDNSILCHNYFWKSCCFELAKNCTFEDGEPLILDWVLVKLQLNSDRAQF